MIDIEALEIVAEPRQLTQTAVSQRPVGQHTAKRGEDVKRTATAGCVGIEEGRNEHVATVLLHLSRTLYTGIARLNTVAEGCYRGTELLKRLRAITIVGIAHTLERTLQTHCRHRKRTTVCRRHAFIHILYALRLVHCATCREVDLHVTEGLQRHPHLKVLTRIGGGRCCHTVIGHQPSSLVALVDKVIARKSKGKAQTRCHCPATVALTEGISRLWDESRKRHAKLVAICKADASHHHEEVGSRLCRLIPPLGVDGRFWSHTQHHLHSIHVLDEYLVVINHLVFQWIVMSVLGLGLHHEALRLLAVAHGHSGVGLEGDFLLEGVLVEGELLLVGGGTIGASFSGFSGLFSFAELSGLSGFAGFLGLRARCRGFLESLVHLLEEGNMVIEILEIPLRVDIEVAVVADGVAERCAVVELGAAHPRICSVVCGVGVEPVEDRHLVERQLI